MKWFIVVCRIPHDDEDSLFIFQAEDGEAAVERAKEELEVEDSDPDPLGDATFYLNYVVECDTEPRLVVANA